MPLNKSLESELDKIIIGAKQEEWAGHHKFVSGWEELHTPTLKRDITALISEQLKNQREDIRSKLPKRHPLKVTWKPKQDDVMLYGENKAIDQITKILEGLE